MVVISPNRLKSILDLFYASLATLAWVFSLWTGLIISKENLNFIISNKTK